MSDLASRGVRSGLLISDKAWSRLQPYGSCLSAPQGKPEPWAFRSPAVIRELARDGRRQRAAALAGLRT
jgi:hypothetical protein